MTAEQSPNTPTAARHSSNAVVVVGHLNPDTDAIASAVGYAWLLRKRDEVEAIAARAGAINPQTAWVLSKVGIEPPEYVADASPRFESVARRVPALNAANTLREAWEVAARAGSAPILDGERRPAGLVTGESVFSYISRRLASDSSAEKQTVEQVLKWGCLEAADTGVPQFRHDTRLRDARASILRDERDDFWVVDGEGHYLGICRTPDVLNPPRLRLVLVDHNEVSQAVAALEEAEVIEVLDHHRLGNQATRVPIPFHVEPVGSASTLVAERILGAGLTPPAGVAGLLLAGLLSDTLALRSPTTTPRDRAVAAHLSAWAFVEHGPLAGLDAQAYGAQLLAAGAGLSSRTAEEIVSADYKAYEAGGVKFAIAQAEVPSLLELDARLTELQSALDVLCAARGLDLAVLMVTDIVRGTSRLLRAGAVDRILDLPYAELPDGTLDAAGVVSRKKQLLPAILGLLQA